MMTMPAASPSMIEISRTPSRGRPPLSPERILTWADAHRKGTGRWPSERSGPVVGVRGESWSAINSALRRGFRGLPGGQTLASLLDQERGVRDGVNPETPDDRMRAWEAENFPARRPHKAKAPAPRDRGPIWLSVEQILAWVDAHHAETGGWPKTASGPVRSDPTITWSMVNRALDQGLRGLPGGQTLADLLQEHRGVNNKHGRPRLTIEQILAWADAHREATGEYPDGRSGPVIGGVGDTWRAIQSALASGRRGLPGGSSISRLLQERRDHRGPLTIERILAWADAHQAETGRWPTSWSSRKLRGVPGESWPAIDMALRDGRRGLPGGSSLARLLAEERQAENIYTFAPLSEGQILAWADAEHAATGRWPSSNSGPVHGVPGERWGSIETALRDGYRGLPGGQTLGRLLQSRRGGEVFGARPRLTEAQILAWADAYHAENGSWPTEDAGPIPQAPDESWKALSGALAQGSRGLPGGSSLARLLARHRGARNCMDLPALSEEQILAWADAHREATGRFPSMNTGPVDGAPGESWSAINSALSAGFRGLSGGSSLARLLDEHRSRRPRTLTIEQVRAWAGAHREATGRWPDANAGPLVGVPDETWAAIDMALREGRRGLPGGTSLTRLFGRVLDPHARGPRPPLTIEQILTWADQHRAETGRWPVRTSGPVAGAPGEKWVNIDTALRIGRRGLPRETSLSRVIAEHRGAAGGD